MNIVKDPVEACSYAMPHTSGKKGKKKKGKGREEEAEQQELTEEEKAALYSIPDKKGQKARSEGVRNKLL